MGAKDYCNWLKGGWLVKRATKGGDLKAATEIRERTKLKRRANYLALWTIRFTSSSVNVADAAA